MKRRIIELGHQCMVVSLPRKWVLENNLKKGRDLMIEEQDNKLVISTSNNPKLMEITVDIVDTTESGLRTYIINAYRAGYDKITVNYSGLKDDIIKIVDRYMLGFEVLTMSKNKYVIESVAEPDVADFEKIVVKEFQIIREILTTIEENNEDGAYRVRKYDNFLKRCMTKYNLYVKERGFIWQFISGLVHISNQCLDFWLELKGKIKLSAHEQDVMRDIIEMFTLLQDGYMRKDVKPLIELHSIERKAVFQKGAKHLSSKKDSLNMHYLMQVARLIYLATSPLTGIIQTETFSSNSRSTGSIVQ